MDIAINNVNEADKEQINQNLQKTIDEKEEELLIISSQLSELQAQNFNYFNDVQRLNKNLKEVNEKYESLKVQNDELLEEVSQNYLEGVMDIAINNVNEVGNKQIHKDLQNRIDKKEEKLLTISAQLSELQVQNFE